MCPRACADNRPWSIQGLAGYELRLTVTLQAERLCRALQSEARDGKPCRSVATHHEFCAYHAALADELDSDVVAIGDQRRREMLASDPVIA